MTPRIVTVQHPERYFFLSCTRIGFGMLQAAAGSLA
jgi:hypothetical protein